MMETKLVKVAVLLAVFNRRETTLQGLRTLCNAIDNLTGDFRFDIYMTDDGCTDGTGESVRKEFPDVKIIDGDGTLFWGGGMLKAWQTAIHSGRSYDYYIWYNDDSDLHQDALTTLFKGSEKDIIITGAFCDDNNVVSYGGKDKSNKLIQPNKELQEVYYMNGNLVLIPKEIVDEIGLLDKRLIHGGGDFEYGIRARKFGYKIMLTSEYVGKANRHDEEKPKYCQPQYSMRQRLKYLKSPIYNPKLHFYYNTIAYGKLRACLNYVLCYIGATSPAIYSYIKKNLTK